ncbi:MAG TPA: thioesterase family protein [Microthrixaceae bacterium]|nr:thioesterase family protein [Microthrixaceae bacterium]
MSSDSDFFGLVPGELPGRYTFGVEDHLARYDGHLYGGTAIGVSIAAAELISDRPAVWMTTQFVATAPPGETISVHAEVLAPGRRTNQIRITGTDPNGVTMFASLGATGHHRPGGLSGVFEQAPTVDRPEDSANVGPLEAMVRNAGIDADLSGMSDGRGFLQVIEFRQPTIHYHPDPGPGRVCFWVRRRDHASPTPAIVAFMADMVPLSVAHAAGEIAGGISLDNSIRVGAFEETEWVLLDMRPHLAAGDYGHGAVHIWSEAGHLLATASQTSSMIRFEPPPVPEMN